MLKIDQVKAAAVLLAGGATVPFIAHYRKEATGSLDEVAIAAIRDRLAQLEALDQRRNAILSWLAERQLLTDELAQRIEHAESLAALEDLCLPFRPKRRTRASVARERGLEPLAMLLLRQDPNEVVRVHQPVQVTVLEVDLGRRRIALSMRRRKS